MSTESLIELAELVLKNNYFEFNYRFRNQKERNALRNVKPYDSTEYARTIPSFDNRCNQLEKWLSDKNYIQKLVKEQIPKALTVSRET